MTAKFEHNKTEIYDIKPPEESLGLPTVKVNQNDRSNQRRLLQRSYSTLTPRQLVPPLGHEYDFRRSPDTGRLTPRKSVNGQIRPCIPPDTLDLESLRLQSSPMTMHTRRARLNVSRCPTPMPSEKDVRTHDQLPEMSHTAWDGKKAGNITRRYC